MANYLRMSIAKNNRDSTPVSPMLGASMGLLTLLFTLHDNSMIPGGHNHLRTIALPGGANPGMSFIQHISYSSPTVVNLLVKRSGIFANIAQSFRRLQDQFRCFIKLNKYNMQKLKKPCNG
ncbi:hypothetical protein PoB_006881100 [Plakobranchus ocellatus]|uniref:Uncharacterized protein n=1 Tax=Plakobranchus ocellatus TaxID=259542 RepID=A0AAV4DDW0_9GAST|nr:hypothetical protein PoB_006881100 [Plakobranchus ocellatus]